MSASTASRGAESRQLETRGDASAPQTRGVGIVNRTGLLGFAITTVVVANSHAESPPTSPLAAEHGTAGDVPNLVSEIKVLEEMFPAMALCHWSRNPDETAFVYGDPYGLIRHIVTVDGELHENWRSFPLGTIREVLTADLDNDGHQEIVTYTADSRMYVWTMKDYELVFDSSVIGEEFGVIQALTIADVDADDAKELILCADNRIVYYDGVEFFREREGRERIEATYMLVGDVDGDGSDELVTNDGHVIDTTTLIIEWSAESFGYPIRLFDIDNDGVLEVVGERQGMVTFWDIAEQREMW